jgi:hypothetical protein
VVWQVYMQTVVSVSEWCDRSTCRLLFQCQSGVTGLHADCCFSVRVVWQVYMQTVVSVSKHYENPTKCLGLEVKSRYHHHLIKCYLLSSWNSWKITHLALNSNHSLTHISCHRLPLPSLIFSTPPPPFFCVSTCEKQHMDLEFYVHQPRR